MLDMKETRIYNEKKKAKTNKSSFLLKEVNNEEANFEFIPDDRDALHSAAGGRYGRCKYQSHRSMR